MLFQHRNNHKIIIFVFVFFKFDFEFRPYIRNRLSDWTVGFELFQTLPWNSCLLVDEIQNIFISKSIRPNKRELLTIVIYNTITSNTFNYNFCTQAWCNGQYARLECSRLWVQSPIGSNQILSNWYVLLLR